MAQVWLIAGRLMTGAFPGRQPYPASGPWLPDRDSATAAVTMPAFPDAGQPGAFTGLPRRL